MRIAVAIVLGLIESVLIPFSLLGLTGKAEDRGLFAALALAAVLVGVAGFRYSPPGKGKWIFVGAAFVLPGLLGCFWFMLMQSHSPF